MAQPGCALLRELAIAGARKVGPSPVPARLCRAALPFAENVSPKPFGHSIRPIDVDIVDTLR
jgi:hypothetical protein